MKFAKVVFFVVLTGTLGAGLAAAAEGPSLVPADLAAAPQVVADEVPAACGTPQLDGIPEFTPKLLAASSFSGCFSCTSSSQCQPICGGQVGSDFVCHYEPSCGPGRYCLCF